MFVNDNPKLGRSWMTSCPVRPAAPPDPWPFPRSTFAGSPGPAQNRSGSPRTNAQGRLGHLGLTAGERRLWALWLQRRK
jgi:hypothetical protein